MVHARAGAAGCLLPSGRFAVLGGWARDGSSRDDCEAYDVVTEEWIMLPDMESERAGAAAVAVAGGLVIVGGADWEPDELFDECHPPPFNIQSIAIYLLSCCTDICSAAVTDI